MLSFYEFDCLLEKSKKAQRKTLREADDLDDLFQQVKGQKPAQRQSFNVEPPTPPAAAPESDPFDGLDDLFQQVGSKPSAAPTPPPAATPPAPPVIRGGKSQTRSRGAKAPLRRDGQATVNQGHDPNEFLHRADRKSSAMPDTGGGVTGRAGRQVDQKDEITSWNDMLRHHPGEGDNGPLSHSKMYLMHKMKMSPEQIPQGRFVFTTEKGGSGQNEFPELVLPKTRILDLIKWVRSELYNRKRGKNRTVDPTNFAAQPRSLNDPGFRGGLAGDLLDGTDRKDTAGVDKKVKDIATQALATGGSNDQRIPKIQRAIQFEKTFRDGRLVDREMSVQQLAKALAEIAGPGTGGLEKPDPMLDLQATAHLIRVAIERGHPFFTLPGGEGAKQIGPQTRVIINNPRDMGKSHDDPVMHAPAAFTQDVKGNQDDVATRMRKSLEAKRTAAQANRQVPPSAGGPAPKMESNQWSDMMSLLEYWGF
jgi:hypothetical protein